LLSTISFANLGLGLAPPNYYCTCDSDCGVNPEEGMRDHFRGDCLRCEGSGLSDKQHQYVGYCACMDGWWGGPEAHNYYVKNGSNKYNGRWISSNRYKCNQKSLD